MSITVYIALSVILLVFGTFGCLVMLDSTRPRFVRDLACGFCMLISIALAGLLFCDKDFKEDEVLCNSCAKKIESRR